MGNREKNNSTVNTPNGIAQLADVSSTYCQKILIEKLAYDDRHT